MVPDSMSEIVCSGGLFLAKNTKRFLLLLRTQGRTAGTWGLAGGKKEPTDLTPHDALIREISEEIGFIPAIIKTVPLELYSSQDKLFSYHTYVIIVDEEFIPKLNEEHCGYSWVELNAWPKPLHNGLKNTLNSRTIKGKLQTILDVIT
jgi:8-oxo-dGTP pyrophosphatase MutT (NUDIX family)